MSTHNTPTVVLKRANGRRKHKHKCKNGRGGCQKVAIGTNEAERRLGTEICSSSSRCLHLAAHILKRLQTQIHLLVGLSFCQLQSAAGDSSQTEVCRKKDTLLCFTLSIWEHTEAGNLILAQLFGKSKQRLVRFWREKSDILRRQWQNNPENRPTWEWFTCLPCHSDAQPRKQRLWLLTKISEREQYSLTTNLQRRNPPLLLKIISPTLCQQGQVDWLSKSWAENSLGTKSVRQFSPVCVCPLFFPNPFAF